MINMINTRKIELGFFLILAVLAGTLTFFIFQPYLSALFLAVIFAIVFRPLNDFFLKLVRGRGGVAALFSVGVLIVAIVVPVCFFGFFIFKDAQAFYLSIANGEQSSVLTTATAFVESVVGRFFPGFSLDVTEYLKQGLSILVSNLGAIFGTLFTVVLQLFLMLLGVFYFLKDGAKFREQIIIISPLSDVYDKTILGKLEVAINSVVKGSLLVALIQGVLSGIGFALFGVPSPMLWGALAGLAALVPGVGTSLVIIPAIIYLFFFKGGIFALGLLVWGALAVGLIDNILSPFLIERGLKVHPFLILLSVLGGLVLFGPVGFIAGPVALALLFALLDIYPRLFSEG